jgi:hypothetical protein
MSSRLAAQNEPVSIPTAVAKAASVSFGMIGPPRYFDGRTPTGWPAALVPQNATIIGGAVVGDSVSFRMQTAVFSLPHGIKPDELLRALLSRAGYGPPVAESAHTEGFASSAAPASELKYCKGSSMAMFDAIDTTRGALVVALHIIDGDAGRQNCAPKQPRPSPARFPVTIPTMTAPAGVMSFGGGSNWGGSSGGTASTLRTTLAVDSILLHYTPQLVAAGWKSVGKPALGGGVAVQRFTFREDQSDWVAVLIVVEVGDQREIRLQYTKVQ